MYFISRISRLAFQVALLAVVPGIASSQVAMVHVTSCGQQAFPSTCAIPSTGRGNLLVVGFQIANGSSTATTINSITDNAGNVYAEAGAARAVDTALGTVIDIWYAKNSVSGATALTIAPSTGVNAGAVIWELSGADPTAPLDQTAVLNSQASTTTVTGAPVTVAPASEVIIAIAEVANSVTGITSGNTFTNDSTVMSNGWAHLIASAPGTYGARWNQSPAGTYDSSTASFKAASAGPNFTTSATPASQTVLAGANAGYTVSIVPSGGFTGTVSLSASGMPSGATASFSPSSIIASGSSALTVGTAGATPPASYPLTITGTSGSLIQTATATLVVGSSSGPNPCDFNKDGSTNVVDAQLTINNYLRCPTTAFQTFSSQVVTAALTGVCSATSGLHVVSLNWTASATGGVTYNVYRAATSGGYNYTTPLNSTPISAAPFVDCTVVAGQTYYYVVRSVDSSGNQSASSTETTVPIPSS